MKVITPQGETIDLGTTETGPTVGIIDYSVRKTDDFGVTTVVERGFARRMSVRFALPTTTADALQLRLAGLRATPARWIADERFASLAFEGFLKEFETEIPFGTQSYCRLTVEGLTATSGAVDTGGDPAPVGRASTFRLLDPVAIEGARFRYSSVPETDAPEWSAGTTYAAGARVMKAATHRIYESAAAGNLGNDPAGTSGKWVDVGPTNRWAMFDQALGTATTADNSIVVSLEPATAITGLALLDVVGATVRVQTAGYDRTAPVAAGVTTFLNLPGVTTTLVVTITGAGPVSVGTLLIGRLRGLGLTEASPTAGITDFSRKTVDDFGEVTIVERAWSKRMTAKALIRTDAVDVVANRIAAVRARPVLWIGDEALGSLSIYGFFKDFSIEVAETTAKLSLQIEGLSTAAKVAPLTAAVDWESVLDPKGTKPKDNADKTSENTSADTAKVAGRSAAEIRAEVEAAAAAIDGIADEFETLSTDTTKAITDISAKARQGSPNAIINPEFKDGLAGWGTDPTMLPLWSTGADGPRGTILATNAPGEVYLDQVIEAFPGVHNGLSFEMAGDAGGGGQVIWLNSSVIEVGRSTELRTSGWQRVGSLPTDASFIPPAGAKFGLVRLRKAAGPGTIAFTRIQYQGGLPTDFRSDPAAIVRQRLETLSAQVNTTGAGTVAARIADQIEVAASPQGAIGARFETIEAEFDPANDNGLVARVATNETAAADATRAVTQRTETLEAGTRQSAPNLLVNSDATDGLNGYQSPNLLAWAFGPDGPRGMIFATSATSEDAFLDQSQPASPNLLYSFGVEAATGGGGDGTFQVIWLNGQGQETGRSVEMRPRNWQRMTAEAMSPPGTTIGLVRLRKLAGPGTFAATRLQFQAGPATFWKPGNTAATLRAGITQNALALIDEQGARAAAIQNIRVSYGGQDVSLQTLAGALATVDGRQEIIWQVKQVLPDGTARIALTNVKGGGSTFLVEADNTLFNGNVVINGTLTPLKMNYPMFVQEATDTDGATYARTTPGATLCGGLVAALNLSAPLGKIKVHLEADVTTGFTGNGNQTPIYDSYVYVRVRGPDGVDRDFPAFPGPPGITTARYTFDVVVPVSWFVAGQVTATAFIVRGSTDYPGTPGTPSDPAQPGGRSVDISVTNLALRAEWSFFG